FAEVRRAGLAVAREVEDRAPDLATSRWWKEERHGVFIDYNQNARDRTTASAYSVRPTPDARVSTPLAWDEVPGCDPPRLTAATVLARYAERGDLAESIDAHPGDLAPLLDLAQRQIDAGLEEPPLPPPDRDPGERPTGRRTTRSKTTTAAGTTGET